MKIFVISQPNRLILTISFDACLNLCPQQKGALYSAFNTSSTILVFIFGKAGAAT
jgi:hypothetical protein